LESWGFFYEVFNFAQTHEIAVVKLKSAETRLLWEQLHGADPIIVIGCSRSAMCGSGLDLGPPSHYFGGDVGTILVIVVAAPPWLLEPRCGSLIYRPLFDLGTSARVRALPIVISLPCFCDLEYPVLPLYQISFLKGDNQDSRPPEFVECIDDQEAIQKAMPFVDAHDVEVLDGRRLITRFPGNPGQ
jgi:hypothetical protein